jgi:NTE family protein
MVEKENKRRHRALILQGGGALGAYEAGAFRALCSWLKRDNNNNTSDDEHIFDIIAGTSIGAINAAIIVSYVKENKTWNYSEDRLWEFWKAMSSISIVETIPGFTLWWDYVRNTMKYSRDSWNHMLSFLDPQTDSYHYPQEWMKWFKDYMDYFVNEYFDIPASGEAARRYYSVKHFLITGANNVFQPLAFGIHDFFSPIALAKPDFKFYDNIENLWFRYGNLPLRRLLLNQNYLLQPSIKSDSDSDSEELEDSSVLVKPKEPRLLLVTVDVETGTTVTIDSYSYPYKENECKICKKSYDNIIDHIEYDHKIPCKGTADSFSLRWSGYRDKENNSYIIIHDGITIDHILASASVPIHYDYQKINVWKFKHQNKKSSSPGNEEDTEKEGHQEDRKFWDGQVVSNTPLREVINEHQRYWKKILDKNNKSIRNLLDDKYKIPDLDVYIVSLWPKEEKDIPKDHDGQIDRRNDISFYDKTEYDQKVAELVSDYIEMAKELARKVNNEGDLERIMSHTGTSKSRTHNRSRSYKELLSGAIDVNVTRIERKDDRHAISQKWADYSSGTISSLYKEGIRDTLNKLLEKEIIEEIDSLANKSQSGSEKEILIDLANYISKIMGNEDSRYESYNFNEVPSIIKQRINETRQDKQKQLSTSNTERILDRIDQSGAKYIEVFRVCLDYDHASPYSLTKSE